MHDDNCPPNCALCTEEDILDVDDIEVDDEYPWEWDEGQEDDEMYEETLED